MFNCYWFKVRFSNGTHGCRVIPANTYDQAINALYFPSPDFSHIQPVDEAELILLRKGTTYLGNKSLSTPGAYDHKESHNV